MEVYAEQSIPNENIEKHKTRTKVLQISRYVCIALIVIILFIFMYTTPVDSILFFVIFYLLIIIPLIAAFIFIGRYINKSNLEYDYYLDGNIFRIVKVINRKKRRILIQTNISSIESIGRITSETYDRYAAAKEIKQIIAFCDAEEDEEIFYIYTVIEAEKKLIHICPDENMVLSLRRCVSRISILDKSINSPIKKPEKPANDSLLLEKK